MQPSLYQTVIDAAAAHSSWNKAADSIGMGRTRFRQLIKQAGAFQQFGVQSPIRVEPIVEPPKPRVSARSDGSSYRILAIGDVHDSPKLPDKSRLKWIARHAAKTRPDKIVQIGDFGDFASCSMHEPPGSIGYSHKPSFRQDLESLEEALTVIFKEIGSDIPLLLTEGNHEHRVQRWEEAHPAVEGGFYEQLQAVWARFGWKAVPFGEWLFIGGVGFTHVPMNIMGRAYGGKAAENQIANDALFSVVFGHTHRSVFKRAPKIGPSQSIQILNLGSAMPEGYVASYAGTATTGWSYGIFELEIRAGHIIQHHEIPLSKLETLYGD